MGHKRAQYNDIRSKGPEFLREQYMKADFGITPKHKLNDRQVIEALLRARGFDPTRLLRTEAFDSEGYSEPHRLTVEDRNIVETRKLADLFAKSVLDQANNILSSSSKCAGSPGEIRTPVDGSLPGFGVQSPSLAGSSFLTLASPLHHRATRDPGLRPSPNKPSALFLLATLDPKANSNLQSALSEASS